MRYVEMRRHTMRVKPGDHLSQPGVTLARRVGEQLGPFALVITSKIARAFETALAMGFAVDEQSQLLNTYGSLAEAEVPFGDTDFAGYAAAVRAGGAAAIYALKLTAYLRSVAGTMPEGSTALVIAHGGVVELGAVASVPEIDFAAWGDYCDYCEGVRLAFDSGQFVAAEVLRLP